MGKKGLSIGVIPVAVVSIKDGTVDVILKCDLFGEVYCNVERKGPQYFEATIWQVENKSAINKIHPRSIEAFEEAIHKISLDMVSHCYRRPYEWTIIEQEPEYDVFKLKEDMSQEALSNSAGLKVRFPLFNDFGN